MEKSSKKRAFFECLNLLKTEKTWGITFLLVVLRVILNAETADGTKNNMDYVYSSADNYLK